MTSTSTPNVAALLTVDQVAARYQLAPKTIRAYARAGRVPGARRIGQRWRFDPTTLDILPAPAPTAPQAVIHPTAPPNARRATAGSGREAMQQALARPIKAPAARGTAR